MAIKTGKIAGFMQELMLRISSEEERLIQDNEFCWYSRAELLANKHRYNFYITTDFATSSKQTADYTVIFVWAYNANGDWFWVDGIMAKQKMDKTVDDLFRLVQKYKPLQVGVEITGQQGGFIPWLQKEMLSRNIWFNFASSGKTGEPGIRSPGDKLVRFNLVVPLFKLRKMYYPIEMKQSVIMGTLMGQYRLATQSGLKGKDDGIDGTSQLAFLNPWKPNENSLQTASDNPDAIWDDEGQEESVNALSSYIV